MVRYYSYIEITRRAHQTLWREYEHLQAMFDNFAMQHIRDQDDIYPVFRELFQTCLHLIHIVIRLKEMIEGNQWIIQTDLFFSKSKFCLFFF